MKRFRWIILTNSIVRFILLWLKIFSGAILSICVIHKIKNDTLPGLAIAGIALVWSFGMAFLCPDPNPCQRNVPK